MTTTLYQQVLGDDFSRLHPVLQRFHGSVSGGRASGTFRVIHHPGWMRRGIISAMGLPPASEAVVVSLEVACSLSGETWTRWFDGRPLVTRQAARGRLLIESAGGTTFGLQTTATPAGGLRMETARVWVIGLPCPRRLAPVVEADVEPRETGWFVAVRMRLPFVGPLLEYQGEITPTWT